MLGRQRDEPVSKSKSETLQAWKVLQNAYCALNINGIFLTLQKVYFNTSK